jgi:hypothetical protein
MALFDDAEISIPCPECGTTVKKSPEWIKSNDHFECECGRKVKIEAAGLQDGLEEAQRKVKEFKKRLKGIGKRR